MWNGNRPALAISIMSALGGSARMPGTARHHMRVGVGENNDLARIEQHRLFADQAGKATARRYHVIGDQVIGARQNSRKDHLARRRTHRPRLLRRNFEIGGTGQPYRLQKIRERVGCHRSIRPSNGRTGNSRAH